MSSGGTDLPPWEYEEVYGKERYWRWAEDYLGITHSLAQRKIHEAVAEHERVCVVGANGPGKSYATSTLALSFWGQHNPSTVLATSGTYGKLRRTLCKPIEKHHRKAKRDYNLPGRYKHSPPRIEVDEEPDWYFEAARPRDAGELEGTHNDYLLAIVEEADKSAVDLDVIESMDSLLTDSNDRFLVIGNPPHDETNSMYQLMESKTWHTIHISTFESHNVMVDAGEIDAPKIPGLTALSKVKNDWLEYNREPWPGYEMAKTAHERRDDLDERWYRRRAGVVPPSGAEAHRPFRIRHVRDAFERTPEHQHIYPSAVGIDVARSGDSTVMVAKYDDMLVVEYDQKGKDHEKQGPELANIIRQWPTPRIAVDFVGSGQAIHDKLNKEFVGVSKYMAGAKAIDQSTYRFQWAEGLGHFGHFLKSGGCFTDKYIKEEAMSAARNVQYEEHDIDTRKAKVLGATEKDVIKEDLGRSPDYLDAAVMAVWIDATKGRPKVPPVW